MAECPKCKNTIQIILSDKVTCPSCKSDLKATLSPRAKPILVFLLVIETLIGIFISVVAASIPYPFVTKWIITGAVLLGLIILSIILLLFVLQRFMVLRRI